MQPSLHSEFLARATQRNSGSKTNKKIAFNLNTMKVEGVGPALVFPSNWDYRTIYILPYQVPYKFLYYAHTGLLILGHKHNSIILENN